MLYRPLAAALLAAGLVAGAATSGCGADPPLDVAPSVDYGKFEGKWYEIAKLPRVTQTDCHGTTAFYSRDAQGRFALVNQCNVGGAGGPLKTVTMTATTPDMASPAKLALDVGGYVGDYWILEVGPQYEYAVIGHPSRTYFWILSRTATLESSKLQGIIDRARANQFDTTKLEFTPQPPAGERAASDAPEGEVPPPQDHGCAMRGGVGDARTPDGARADWLLMLLAIPALAGGRRRARRSMPIEVP